MAYFADLTIYAYLQQSNDPLTLNVGWLAAGYEFPQHPPTKALLDKLFTRTQVSVNATRGVHDCEFCPRGPDFFTQWPRPSSLALHDGKILFCGNAEIRVVAADGTIYAAPSLLFHYVSVHHYAPPAPFVEALLEDASFENGGYLKFLEESGLHHQLQTVQSATP